MGTNRILLSGTFIGISVPGIDAASANAAHPEKWMANSSLGVPGGPAQIAQKTHTFSTQGSPFTVNYGTAFTGKNPTVQCIMEYGGYFFGVEYASTGVVWRNMISLATSLTRVEVSSTFTTTWNYSVAVKYWIAAWATP